MRPQNQQVSDRQLSDPEAHPRVALAAALTRAGMWWEQAARAFWPLVAVLGLLWACLAFGLVEPMPRAWAFAWLVLAVLALAATGLLGIRRFRRPSHLAALHRVDATLPGKPLSALRDSMVLGQDDPGATALWQAHQRRMMQQAALANAVAPNADLPRRDPYALRLVGVTALAMALVFAPSGKVGQGLSALASTFRPAPQNTPTIATGPGWEGWAEPPAYTRRPTIYLNSLPEGEALTIPKGTTVSFRLYGEGADLQQNIGPEVEGADPMAPEFTAERDGVVQIAGRSFPITVQPDAAPVVQPGAAPVRRADGRLIQQFTASDDNGIAAGEAVISLDLAAVDRRYGLTPAPEPRDDLTLRLPLPATGQRSEIQGQLVADLAQHPWANLPVTIRLEVEDGIAQKGQSAPMPMVLPGRRFFDPLGAALIELRRDLLWSRDNGPRSAELLRTIVWQPDGFVDEPLLSGLQGAIGTLESGPLDDKTRDALAVLLWEAAVALEDGGLADALERMQQAQERLSEAIRNGASPDEIQRLMDELREATDAYTDMLAEQGEDPAERFDRSPRDQRQRITGDQIQQMMDEIQRLMNEGRMAEAQELLEQFNRMMENLRFSDTPGEGGMGRPRQMDRLADTLREQQQLSDDAMRELQEQFSDPFNQQGQQSQGQQQGEQGQSGGPSGGAGRGGSQGDPSSGGQSDDRSLAERQRDLREELGRQRGLLPGQGSDQGDRAARQLDDAGRAMEQAEQALRDGDIAGAMERQAQAIQSMREGMRALGDMMAEQQGEQGQPGERGNQDQNGDNPRGRPGDPRGQRGLATPYSRQPSTDPLGRALDGQGNLFGQGDRLADGPDPMRRARDLVDEIRRRLGERDRSTDERDYLGRLIDRF
ncbi:DUF4175 domain-containing protein [Paracoccus sp. DMF-8]|uniref:DUF4175 domain-containing protein n=1 Tax=Paracoccus sp. DMF-8 TaxID=3019445 RepID=UPI0023E4318E|nr:DUF4175 domain-containing protein [Paracoccus sp. DMF-8]MDF3607665.1 DUF4175 domain-containing protein [Paracoccus sp. DMF-8]